MKLLVLSDTHHALGFACEAIEKEAPDVILHLGDHIVDAQDLCYAYPLPDWYYVPGNCDYVPTTAAQQLTLDFDTVRIFATHGHLYGVKQGLTALCGAAKDAGAQLALFGHTHHQLLTQQAGITLFNPGAAGPYGQRAYGVIEVEHGTFRCRLETDTE